jgi:nicotinamide-nucleotide amidase
MRAEVMAVGDELTTGQRLDTNSQWLAEQLTACGVEVAWHTTVGDQLQDHVAAYQIARDRADVVVCTGGLGPTADDLTRQALAQAAGVELVRDEPSLAHIQQLFASRGREMPAANVLQAEFPEGAVPIANKYGTAPGIDLTMLRPERTPCRVFALPGVPAEMRPMWTDTVAPAIRAALPAPRLILHRRLKCFGVGESQLEAMLPDLIRRGREPVVGITVSDATITLRITTSGPDAAACRERMAPTEAVIRETLGTLVFGEEEEELEEVVVRALRARDQSVAVAEWATRGLLVNWLLAAAERPEAIGRSAPCSAGREVVAGGWTVASHDAASRLAGRDLSPEPAHAPQMAVALAESVRASFDADYGVGVAAFPGDPDDSQAHLTIALATGERTHRLRFPCATHPAIRHSRAAKQTLNALRLHLLS